MANPVWNVRYPFPVRERTYRDILRTPAVTGMVQRRQRNQSFSSNTDLDQVGGWVLSWTPRQPATLAEIQAIETFWDDSIGGVRPIDFTPPGYGSAIPCSIEGDSFRYRRIGPNTYTTQIEFREAINIA